MEERREERHGITVQGRYRTGSGMAVDVTLRDLSKGGCQVHDRLGRLEVEQFLTIRIGPIGPIDSRVRWLDGRVAGIRFDAPLNDSVLDHIREIAAREAPQPRAEAEAEAEVKPERADRRDAHVPGKTRKLDLLEKERHYNELIKALDLGADGEEVLVGLDRGQSEWLIRWRRERRSEREARPTYRSDKPRADRLEELHEQARRLQLGY